MNADGIVVDGFGEKPLRYRRGPRTPDIVILGTGRSGTSAVARILHEHFGVCFGHHETMLKDFRGEMVYEDKTLKKMIRRVVKGEVDIDSWLAEFDKVHHGCEARHTGAKLLDFGALSTNDFIAIRPRLVISTYRPYQSCVESWVRYRKSGMRYRRGGIASDDHLWHSVQKYVAKRQKQIDGLLRELRDLGFCVRGIHFVPEEWHCTDEELIERIGKWMSSCL